MTSTEYMIKPYPKQLSNKQTRFKMRKTRFLKGNSILLLNKNIVGHFNSLIFADVTVYNEIFNLNMLMDYKYKIVREWRLTHG